LGGQHADVVVDCGAETSNHGDDDGGITRLMSEPPNLAGPGSDYRATAHSLTISHEILPTCRVVWNNMKAKMDLRRFSYGSTSAVVTGMALVIGLDAASSSRATVVASLLVFAVADNLTDSLSIHVYQESERLDDRAAFRATLTNYAARLGVSVSFVPVVMFAPASMAGIISLLWGGLLLGAMTALVARERGAPVATEIGKHFALAAVVVVVSKAIGTWLLRALG
jgi:VIT1/CCC1 family predicted Fe2+/Mn2+ transporter